MDAQALPDLIDAHVRAFGDRRRSRTRRAGQRQDRHRQGQLLRPQVNRTYADMAAHYRTAILPARPRKPRDKAKAEQAVLIVERWLLGRLRRRCSPASLTSTPRSASL